MSRETRDALIGIAKGAAIAAAGAVLTYLTAWVGAHDLGTWTPVVVAGWAIVVQAVRKGLGLLDQKVD